MKKLIGAIALCAFALVALAAAPVSVEAHGYNGNFHSNSVGFSGCQSSVSIQSSYSNVGVFATPYVQQIALAVPVYVPPVVTVAAPVVAAPPVVVEAAPPVVQYQAPLVIQQEVIVPTYSSFNVAPCYNLNYGSGFSTGHFGNFHGGHHH